MYRVSYCTCSRLQSVDVVVVEWMVVLCVVLIVEYLCVFTVGQTDDNIQQEGQ